MKFLFDMDGGEYPVVETNHIRAITTGALISQYNFSSSSPGAMSGLPLLVNYSRKEVTQPVDGTEFLYLAIPEERSYGLGMGRQNFAVTRTQKPRLAKLSKGDIFETNAISYNEDVFTSAALLKQNAVYAIPTGSGILELVDKNEGEAALLTHSLVFEVIDWVLLPNRKEGVKLLVKKAKRVSFMSNDVSFTGFSFNFDNNPTLLEDHVGIYSEINNQTYINIFIESALNVDFTKLTPSWTAFSTVSSGGVARTSGVEVMDFSTPVNFVVTSSYGEEKIYIINVVEVEPVGITDFTFFESLNEGYLAQDVVAVITGVNIVASVPFGTDITNLTPTWSINTSTGTVTVDGEEVFGGSHAFDFTNPVEFTLTGLYNPEDVVVYTVTVNIE